LIPSPDKEREAFAYPKREGLVRVVVVVVGIVSVMIIARVVGHRVADGRAAHTADDRADWPAYNRPANRACHPAGDRAAFVSQHRRRRSTDYRRRRGG
jgi:hypothetical protein